jgi:hypothetical protein
MSLMVMRLSQMYKNRQKWRRSPDRTDATTFTLSRSGIVADGKHYAYTHMSKPDFTLSLQGGADSDLQPHADINSYLESNALDYNPGDPLFESRLPSLRFLWFSSVILGKFLDSSSIRSQPPHFKSSPGHHSLMILSSIVISILKASLNNQQTNPLNTRQCGQKFVDFVCNLPYS